MMLMKAMRYERQLRTRLEKCSVIQVLLSKGSYKLVSSNSDKLKKTLSMQGWMSFQCDIPIIIKKLLKIYHFPKLLEL